MNGWTSFPTNWWETRYRTLNPIFLEVSVRSDHNFLPSEYLSYADEVLNETTKPRTKPRTVSIWLLIANECGVNLEIAVTTAQNSDDYHDRQERGSSLVATAEKKRTSSKISSKTVALNLWKLHAAKSGLAAGILLKTRVRWNYNRNKNSAAVEMKDKPGWSVGPGDKKWGRMRCEGAGQPVYKNEFSDRRHNEVHLAVTLNARTDQGDQDIKFLITGCDPNGVIQAEAPNCWIFGYLVRAMTFRHQTLF